MIKIEHAKKSFKDNEVLKDVSLEMNAHEVICLVGPSGSGKSTLLRSIIGLEMLDDGKIYIDDELVNYDDEKLMCKLRLKVGFVFQHFNLFPHLNVLDNITLSPVDVLNKTKEEAKEEAMLLLKKVGLEDKAYEFPNKLSGGQKQRIAIARALALHPDYMLFDEPTSALDPEMVKEVLNVMKDLAKDGMGMIIVTHEMAFARQVADCIAFFEDGKIVEKNNANDFFDHPSSDRLKEFLSKIDY